MAEVRQSYGLPLSVSVKTDVGRVRANNEDAHGYAWLEDGALFVIVADGMGGHEAGEVASGLAVRVVEDAVTRDTDADPRDRLYTGLLEANESILDEGRRSGTRGMGTTAITAVLRGQEVHVGLIGDSRLYHIRRGQLLWRTLDHTRVQMLIDQGEISEEEARNHPEAGMLTRALGHSRMADGQALVPDVLADPLYIEEYDVLVLCSDGLHDLVDDWEVAQTVAGKRPEDACDALIELACDRGGHDNITVAVIVAGERSEPYDANYAPDLDGGDPDTWEDQLPPPAPEPEPSTHFVQDVIPHAAAPAPAPAGGSNNMMIVGIIVVLFMVLAGLGLFFLFGAGLLFAMN